MDLETRRFEQASLQVFSLQMLKVLDSIDQEMIPSMMEFLEQHLFIWHHARGFEQSALVIAYQKEEDT